MAELIGQRSECLSAEETGMREVKAHKQIIYGSISHLTKLPEVKQAGKESILAASEQWHKAERGIMMSGEVERKKLFCI